MSLCVSAAGADRQVTALSLLFSRFPTHERRERMVEVLEAARHGDVSLEGLLLVDRDAEPVGAALFLLQPDRTAFVWPPVARPDVPEDQQQQAVDALFAEIHRRVAAADTWLAQCLVEPYETGDREALSRNGFGHLADLLYLRRSLAEPLPPLPHVPFQTTPFSPASNGERFARLLERTYHGTLDCPRLKGRRSGAEALVSHRLSGGFDPRRWKIYSQDSADIGLLLLNDQPDQNAWEVVYMGVVPEARGRGYGRAMLLSGLDEARRADRGGVVLAVDAGNKYATDVYRDLGFVEWAMRAVHAWMPNRPRREH